MEAASSDPLLLNWEKLTGRPVVPVANPDGSPLPIQMFDPAIWNKDLPRQFSVGLTGVQDF